MKRADIRIDFPVVSVSSQSLAREEVEDEGTPPVEVVEKTKVGTKTLNIPGVKVSDLIRTNLVEPPLKLEKSTKVPTLKQRYNRMGQSFSMEKPTDLCPWLRLSPESPS